MYTRNMYKLLMIYQEIISNWLFLTKYSHNIQHNDHDSNLTPQAMVIHKGYLVNWQVLLNCINWIFCLEHMIHLINHIKKNPFWMLFMNIARIGFSSKLNQYKQKQRYFGLYTSEN